MAGLSDAERPEGGDDLQLTRTGVDGDLIWERTYHQEKYISLYEFFLDEDNCYTAIGTIENINANYADLWVMRILPDVQVVDDLSGHGHRGSLWGAASSGEGLWKQALEVPREGGSLVISDADDLHIQTFTIEGWFLMNADVDQIDAPLVIRTYTGGSFQLTASNYYGQIGMNQVALMLTTPTEACTLRCSVNPADGNWHYIAGTYDGNIAALFYDSTLGAWEEIGAQIAYDEEGLFIGGDTLDLGENNHFVGRVDEVRLSDSPREYLRAPSEFTDNGLPHAFRLLAAYPNPFNASTTIRYQIPTFAPVSVRIFELSGRAVATLFNGPAAPGQHQLLWNASGLQAGIYFARLETGNATQTRKITLLR
jgi:hypothetical protein